MHGVLGSKRKKHLSLTHQERQMKVSNTFFYFYYYFFKAQAGL
jgi:hypothetical protein